MAGLEWLFAWAKENGIELPLEKNGSADIRKLLQLYDEWRAKNSGKTYRQNTRHEAILSEDKAGRKPEKATGFNRLNTAHHQRHAKEMGFAILRDYEKAAVQFWQRGNGICYEGTRRGNYAKYNKETCEYMICDKQGKISTYYKVSPKKFEKIKQQEGYQNV